MVTDLYLLIMFSVHRHSSKNLKKNDVFYITENILSSRYRNPFLIQIIQATRCNSFTSLLFGVYVRGSAVETCWLNYLNRMMISRTCERQIKPVYCCLGK